MGDKYYLHYLEVDDSKGLPAAMKTAKRICGGLRRYWYHDEKAHVYRFRNIPRTLFKWETFKSHALEPGVRGSIGKLKDEPIGEPLASIEGDCKEGALES